MNIRPETTADIPIIRAINDEAFEQEGEGRLVDALREADALTLSLVAEQDSRVVGHIAFSPVTIETGSGIVPAIGLAPMSVVKTLQRIGVGSALVREALKRIADAGHTAVIVLGHADYYPKFGFRPASQFGLHSEYEVPDEIFMAKELVNGALNGVSGLVKYHPTFNAL